MREILFRGKLIDNGKWIFGSLREIWSSVGQEARFTICPAKRFANDGFTDLDEAEVIPETVGEYTGLDDMDGEAVFEGDLLRYPPKDKWEEENYTAFEVFWHDNDCADHHIGWQFCRFHFYGCICGYQQVENFLPKYTKQMVIIGNIHDNKELLEAKK